MCLRCGRPGFDPWVAKIPLEKEMATHSSILAQRIPWMEEPDGLQFHMVAKSRTRLSDFTFTFTLNCHGASGCVISLAD